MKFRGSHFDDDKNVDTSKNAAMTRLYEKNHEDEPVFREIENDNSLGSLSSITQEELRTKLTQQHSRIKKLLENVSSQESSDTDENENRTLFGEANEEDGEVDEEGEEETKSPVHISLYGRTNQKVFSYSVVNQREQQHVSVTHIFERG